MSINIHQVSKQFGAFHALDQVSLEIPGGELVALLGPSGSGKTTLLRLIAGLDSPDSGAIVLDGHAVENRPVRERGVGFVFQHYALFRHMTVFENIAFGLRVRPRKERFPEAEIKKRVNRLLALVQLDWLADRYPNQLSGGQRQRVALARALAIEPKLLLLDEPFGALDAKVRKELRRWLRRLHQEMAVTTIFVTHDQDEALEVADRIVIVNKGKVEQFGSPQEVYDHPANPFVFDFLGTANRFRGSIQGGKAALHGLGKVESDSSHPDGSAVGYARPHELVLARERGAATVEVKVDDIQFGGSSVRIELLRLDDQSILQAELSREEYRAMAVNLGERLFVSLKNVRVFHDDYSI